MKKDDVIVDSKQCENNTSHASLPLSGSAIISTSEFDLPHITPK